MGGFSVLPPMGGITPKTRRWSKLNKPLITKMYYLNLLISPITKQKKAPDESDASLEYRIQLLFQVSECNCGAVSLIFFLRPRALAIPNLRL